MNNSEAQRALETMITFFESGTKEADEIAKVILLSEAEYWQEVIEHFRTSIDWTGIRAPEAELLVQALRELS